MTYLIKNILILNCILYYITRKISIKLPLNLHIYISKDILNRHEFKTILFTMYNDFPYENSLVKFIKNIQL